MKIVDRKTFLELPEGTVFSYYFGEDSEGLNILGPAHGPRFSYLDLSDCMNDVGVSDRLLAGQSVPISLETNEPDLNMYPDQLYVIYEPQDVLNLIARLEKAMLICQIVGV